MDEDLRFVKVDKDPWERGIVLFDKEEVGIKKGCTILVGCNGSGKSSFMDQIIYNNLSKENIPFLKFDNYKYGGSEKFANELMHKDHNLPLLATVIQSSEGEVIDHWIAYAATKIGKYTLKHPNVKEKWYFFDAVDSGYSIDNIVEFKNDLIDMLLKHEPESYIIISANSFEMAKGMNCLNVSTGEYLTFNKYEEYYDFIMNSRKDKHRRNGYKPFEI